MDQPDFVAWHGEHPALGQRLKEILVVGDTSSQPAGDERATLDRPYDDNVAGFPLFRSVDDQVVTVDPLRVKGRGGRDHPAVFDGFAGAWARSRLTGRSVVMNTHGVPAFRFNGWWWEPLGPAELPLGGSLLCGGRSFQRWAPVRARGSSVFGVLL